MDYLTAKWGGNIDAIDAIDDWDSEDWEIGRAPKRDCRSPFDQTESLDDGFEDDSLGADPLEAAWSDFDL